jgi:AsmA protein
MKKLEISMPKMQDTQALNQLAVTLNLQATTDSADIQNLKIKLDDSNINGSASVKNFAKPAVKFNLNVDVLDANRYLAPEQEKTAKKVVSPASAAVAGANLFPVETLKNLDANGQLAIGQLKINQLSMKGINFKLNASKGVIKTQQAIKQFYQGAYSGKSSINVQQKTPQLTLNEKLSNVQVEPLLKAMDITDRMSGLVNASAKIQGRGNTTADIKSSLNGNLDFSFNDSIIKGFNLQKIIDNSRALIEGKGLPTENKNDQTVFSVIKGSANINNGLLSNDDLIAQSSKVHVKGKGTANLVTEALNYKIDARVLKRTATETEAEKIRGIPLAVNIGGTFAEPSYQIDIETMLKAKYKTKIDKKINKEKDKILKKLDEKLGPGVSDILKGLF